MVLPPTTGTKLLIILPRGLDATLQNISGGMSPESDKETDSEGSMMFRGGGATYLPPLLVLHPLSIHDTYCGEKRKTGLRPRPKGKWGPQMGRALDGEAPQETLAW